MVVVDGWVNIFPEGFAERWAAKDEQQGVIQLFGADLAKGPTVEGLLEAMDGAGVDTGVLTSGLSDPDRAHRLGGYAAEDFLAIADEHPGRFLVAATVDRAGKPRANCARVRELAQHDALRMVRVTPLVEQYELNHRLYYPVYATCEELGIPVSINVGIPGPQVRSRCQDPVLLEDVLIDFPGLTVVGAHMGHPYEALLIQYMLKWPQLHLMTSAYLATYMDPALVRFMDSSRGRGRVLFASDHPVIPVQKSLDAARKLPLSDEGMALFLGASAQRLLAPR
jgi:predicted TIM-barrel fold metal-dependent hydrolase